MAEAVATFLLERLNNFIINESQLLFGVPKDSVWIGDVLQRMKGFLQSADKRKVTDEELKDWVRRVREVSYDADDILDEFIIQMKNLQQHGGQNRCLNFAEKLKVRHKFATEIQSIRRRVQEISDGRSRYQLEAKQEEGTSSNDSIEHWQDPRLTFSSMEEDDITAIDSRK
ncbi:hypothetical protein AMTRI_Chr10g233140 [Amborella trichopoda]|uniref:Disease resistance N-terminal domain-containing protein n=1 Tax=Amborella trichopoda TaxID=13333 RepID=U5DFA1_AMBTC|nr:hypothetical protein AMTR_s00061p00116100 [Amborella trichopoda]